MRVAERPLLFHHIVRVLTAAILVTAAWLIFVLPAEASPPELTWDPPEDMTGVAGYNIYFGPKGTDTTAQPALVVVDPLKTSVPVVGLTPGVTYVFTATSFDAYGNESPFAEPFEYTVQSNIKGSASGGSSGNSPASEDTVPPTASIVSGPFGPARSVSASFAFTGTDNVTPATDLTFSHRLEGHISAWSSFSQAGSVVYSKLAPGSYFFEVRARDASGNVQSLPTSREFSVSEPSPLSGNLLYFPHVDTGNGWTTEIGIVNNANSAADGELLAYTATGLQWGVLPVTLPARGRIEIDVATTFAVSKEIRYLVLASKSVSLRGYTKFAVAGQYRAALPALPLEDGGDLLVPHIASDATWWTGLGLVNTADTARQVQLASDTGRRSGLNVAGQGHSSALVRQLFTGAERSQMTSGRITEAQGLVGIELFGSGSMLAGVELSSRTATTLNFPHLHSDQHWWTGLVVFNPGEESAVLTITSFSETGLPLDTRTQTVAPGAKYVGLAAQLDLPDDAAWLRVDASRPVTGFELFGTSDGKLLAGFAVTGMERTQGVFPKIERNGWTGIALVNTSNAQVTVTLTARNDSGAAKGTTTVTLRPHVKTLGLSHDLFKGQDVSQATYITFTANGEVAGFQLNGSSDGMQLDGLVGM